MITIHRSNVAGNGEIVATSEAYTRLSSAQRVKEIANGAIIVKHSNLGDDDED